MRPITTMQLDQNQYDHITQVFPRPCADILMVSPKGNVWLMFRANQPCSQQWWFPGGRVYFNESRQQAVARKLAEECHLTDPPALKELGTHDLFFSAGGRDYHDITTLFKIEILEHSVIKTDSQALDHGWFTPEQCAALDLHPYVLHYVRQSASL